MFYRSARIVIRASIMFMRDIDGVVARVPGHFYLEPQIVNNAQSLDMDLILQNLRNRVENFNSRGSGFIMERIIRFTVSVSKFRPLHGSGSYIETPIFLRRKQCIVNIRNFDDKCFLWAVLSALHEPSHNKHRITHYLAYEHSLNVDNIPFPMEVKFIPHFERQNPELSINVLSYDAQSKSFIVEYLSSERGRPHQINLLLLDEEQSSKKHFTWIRSMSKLVAHRTNHNGKTHVCMSCLQPFTTRKALDNHTLYCLQHPAQQVVYPDRENEKDCVLQFRARGKQHPILFYLICDFESFLVPVDSEEQDEECSMRRIDEHQVSGFCCYRVTELEQYQKPPFVYSGQDPMSAFYEHIMAESRAISDILTHQQPIRVLTPQQEADYRNASTCANCGEPFTPQNSKVRHHCHVSGTFLFAACNNCNLQLKPKRCKRTTRPGDKRRHSTACEQVAEKYEENYFLPVIFHNLKCYDAHFVIKHFERKYVERRQGDNISFDDVSVIPLNSEKYLQFQIGNLRFLDSFQFLSTSLEQLVALLLKGGKSNFVHTAKHLGTDDDIVFAKGVYPYSYMSSREKFAETCLPPLESFYDTLRDEPLKQEDYVRAQEIWTKFGISSMEAYHNHYLVTDVLLLTDVFEHFRRSVLDLHGLDCLHFPTQPSLAWSMALKHTGAKLDLITDPDAYLMIENSMRGGIATISQRYASANNPYVDDYVEDETRRYITYLDANSLYATAQSEPLPIGNFRFLSDEEINDFDLFSIKADAEVGYIIECDLAYPPHLHDSHNDYPMAPDHLTVTRDMLSPFALNLLDPKRTWKPTQKLVPNLLDKTKYVTHYRNLQLYVRHGLVITKIHRILSFTQQAWLKPWIELCNEQRKAARSDFESDLAKLQANATFGKTMEQVRHRVNIRLIADENKLLKAVSKVSFRQSEIVNEELVMVRAARTKVKLNKPIAVGFAILEISKLIMYQFYYGYLKAKYQDRCSLLFTDTDSLCCEIQTQDLYRDMGENLNLFDTSNFEADHPQYSASNRRVLGKFKSETGSIAPKEFVGLRAKMYSLHVPSCPAKSQKKAKGIQKHFVKKSVRHSQFLEVLRHAEQTTSCKFRVFRSTNHVVNTVQVTKKCLCAFDDKRYILPDGVHTLAYGHYSLR